MGTYWILVSLILFVCILLILVVMVQNPKGGGLSSSFGGGGTQQLGGVKKTTDFLDNAPNELFLEKEFDPAQLIAIASGAQKLGINKSHRHKHTDDLLNDYNGHESDPFRTLSRNFP